MELQRLKGIIFDKDGTLFDYKQVWEGTLHELINASLNALNRGDDQQLHEELLLLLGISPTGTNPRGLLFSPSKIKIFFRFWWFSLKNHLNMYRLVKAYMAFMKTNGRETALKTIDSLDFSVQQNLFAKLKAHGYVIGLVTNDTSAAGHLYLQHMGLDSFVDFLRGRDDPGRTKPSPASFKEFCKEFSLTSQEVVMVGDSRADFLYAKRAKAGYSIAVLWGSNDKKRLNRMADKVCPTIDCLLNDTTLFPGDKIN